jgi:hypothetical protein
MQLLNLHYQSEEYKKWDKKMTNIMIGDHFIEDRRFSLRSRGEYDKPRPFMETVSKVITGINNSVTSAIQTNQDIQAPVITSLRKFADSLSSVRYEDLRREWSDHADVEDLDDLDELDEYGFMPDEDDILATEEHTVDTDKDENGGNTAAKAV